MLAAELLPQVQAYIARPAVRAALGIAPGPIGRLDFLAQGEYNINYRYTDWHAAEFVVRVNVGTQIGQLGGAQIAYEAAALALLGPHGVAPRLLYVDDTLAALPYGLLAMAYLPGAPLRYDDPAQLAAAARTLARLHSIPAPPNGPFIRRRALIDDLAEARGWLAPYLACDRIAPALRTLFMRLLDRAAAAAERDLAIFPIPFALVHTDVQAHNFIVGQPPAAGGRQDYDSRPPPACRLVDWERPLIDDPTYDLAHFIIPTTTQWKCGYTLAAAERALFLEEYCRARPDLDPAEICARLEVRRPFILLRAISWCASAWVDYTGPGRAIDNRDTLAKIEEYLRPEYLAELFPEWLGAAPGA